MGNVFQFILTFEGLVLLAVVNHVLVPIAQYNNFINSSAVQTGWFIVRDLVNMFYVLILLLIKYALNLLWKTWFFLATTLCLAFAFYAFMRGLPYADVLVTVLAAGLALWKVWKPNVLIHNITELFIYGGLAAIFFPHITIWAALALLALISAYDMYAVWKSKHMVTLANFQKDNEMFAGLSIPYAWPAKKTAKATSHAAKHVTSKTTGRQESKSAVLGGGDMGFPLLFTAAVLTSKGFLVAAIIPPFAALGLFVLLMLAKNDRFYPAMPFISAGCVLGWLVTLLF